MTDEVKLQLDALRVEKEQMQIAHQKRGGEILQSVFANVFNKFSQLQSFSWTQYTPYFNDGDECVFRMNGLHYMNGEYAEDYDRDDPNSAWQGEAYEELDGILHKFDRDTMKDIFGDHAEVTVTRTPTGFSTSVESYEHE